MDIPLSDEDRVIYLLANFPDSYSVLLIALQANSDVPRMDLVINDSSKSSGLTEKAMSVKGNRFRKRKVHVTIVDAF